MKKKILFIFIGLILLLSKGASMETVLKQDIKELNGKLVLKSTSMPFSGVITQTYETGELLLKSNVKDGMLNGERIWYFIDGSISLKESVQYYKNGNIKEKENYKNDEKHGEQMYFHENGKLELKGTFVDGRRVGEWKYK